MFDQAIASFRPGLPVAVALSGGVDSTALLVACALKWPGQVRAVHVHHGLQRAADSFEECAVNLCARLEVPIAVCRIDARHAPGESPEDAARRGRYAAIAHAVKSHWPDDAIGDVAIAQHADDQVETLLLALSRGAGLPGLSAMPAHWTRDGLNWHRPLLRVPGAQLREWLVARGVTWIEDPSNANEQFTRNRIRAQLLPALEKAFPQFRETFARSARHAAQAQELLTELAAQDLERIGNPPVIDELRTLSSNRQGNVLRHWLRTSHDTAPSAAQMDELLAQVASCATRGHHIRIKVGLGRVTRAGAQLQFERD